MAVGLSRARQRIHAAPHRVGDVHGRALQDDLPRAHAADVQEVVDEARELTDLPVDHRARPHRGQVLGADLVEDGHRAGDDVEGLRSSWPSMARNSSLARLAASASSRAICSRASKAARASATCRSTVMSVAMHTKPATASASSTGSTSSRNQCPSRASSMVSRVLPRGSRVSEDSSPEGASVSHSAAQGCRADPPRPCRRAWRTPHCTARRRRWR